MKYGIVGATGLTGLEILKQLPSHDVSVFVRQPDKLPKEMKLEVIRGEVSDQEALTAWASKQETVFVALGHPMSWNLVRYNIGLSQDYPIKGILKDSLSAVMKGKPKRIIYMSAYGTHETRSDLPFVVGKIFLPIFIGETYRDHEEAETLLRSYSEEWVVVRPAQLTNDAARKQYRTEVKLNPWGTGKISRADVAHFMIRSAKDTSWIGQKVGLSY
ncbi:NAD(P)H-binding protein [Collimonas sp. H4R21]|jgi:putative NADH-flavin reductase|uniref:NAD(P)H-binding protein n=1 Tax=Collimonas rhizosphaerae TaxID=3126357 RepID=A0ABU9Q1B0_9BURK|nr:NAD(P)H-binding protein [Collimonas sp. OK412]SFD09297.1 Putative NADH-flavin reductase [Collimonas sp. OK412]